MIKHIFTKLFIFIAIFAALLACITGLSSVVHAYNLDEWRPSVEIYKELDTMNVQKKDNSEKRNICIDYINKYQENSIDYDENISIAQEEFDKIQDFVDQKQPEIEKLTKTSYSTYFAKLLMDEIVGFSFITDNVFHWDLINLFASMQEREILNLLADYYSAQKNLNDAIDEKNNAEKKYKDCKTDVLNFDSQINLIDQRIAYLNLMLYEVKVLESVDGCPGESKIEGQGLFCNPCPGSTIVANVGDLREGYVHKGIDMACNIGMPIYCAADGVVIDSGEHEQMGNFVKIMHNDGFVTIYMHCQKVFVPKNVNVHKGDNIALVGNTGDSSGPHLHFQVEKDGKVVNGLDFM